MDEPARPDPLPSLPIAGRDRLRLLALAGLVVLWTVPVWVRAQASAGPVDETGAVRSGVSAALGLVAVWGLCATSLLAGTLRGLRVGAALTDTVLAAVTTGLLLARHPWIPGGDLREAWVPIFGPLALLGLLDAVVAARGSASRAEIPIIRAGAALFAAGALAIDACWIPAGIALWLGVAPLMFLKLHTARSARRSLEAFVLAACVVLGLAPWIHKTAVGWTPALDSNPITWPLYLWCVTAAFLVTVGLDGLLRPDAESAAA